MTITKPIIYLKENCPFCMKVRIVALESGLNDQVEIKNFVSGEPEEDAIRAELAPHFEKISFPTAQFVSGEYSAESDDIVAALAKMSGKDLASMSVYKNYLNGPFKSMMDLWKENMQLKAAQS